MMDASFWLKLAFSFIIGGAWIALSTLITERFGTRIGGLIAGLPSTVVIALFFIGLTQTPEIAAQVTTIMPLAQGLNGLFVIVFMVLIRHGLIVGLTGALLSWLAQSILLYFLNLHLFWVSIIGWLILLFVSFFMVEKWMKVRSQGAIKINYLPSQILLRALFGGAVISWAVLMGKLGGPLVGGIFSSFPAIFLSTLVITYRSHGADFARAVGKPLLISGTVNVPLYEIAVRWLYPEVGLTIGTVLGILFSLGSGYLTYLFIKARLT